MRGQGDDAHPPSLSGVDLHVELDGSARRDSLERALREAIRTGRLAPGSTLPATRTLAHELGLARGTVSAAYDQLVAEGFLQARTGSGTIVAPLGAVGTHTSPVTSGQTPPRYDLRPGNPDVTMFPVNQWLRSARRALARAPMTSYGYGDPKGSLVLRTALAEYLGRARGVLASPAHIVITSGYVQALALLADVLGGPVGMEDPGLAFHRTVVLRRKRKVVPIPVDERGARFDSVPASVRAIVLTPAHQFPTGVTLHPERRHAATRWARSAKGLLIEDDYDGEFRYDRQPVGALQGMAPDLVIYVGTASKTLGPALRLAWVVLPPRLVEPFTEAKRHNDSHTETLGQLTLADMITSHAYDRHVRSCRLRYRHRRDLLVARLGGLELPSAHELLGISAGQHALIRLTGPESVVHERAALHGLALGDYASHWHNPGAGPPGIIVGYGTPSESAYPGALDALARVLQAERVIAA
jgi:GntR family transcriptional regulator/MocR family aminotransferase